MINFGYSKTIKDLKRGLIAPFVLCVTNSDYLYQGVGFIYWHILQSGNLTSHPNHPWLIMKNPVTIKKLQSLKLISKNKIHFES